MTMGALRARGSFIGFSATVSIALVIALAASAQGAVPELPTVEGPEASGLAERAVGCVIMARPAGGIVAIRLRSGKEMVVRAPGVGRGGVNSLSGPDANGRIIFITDQDSPDTHSLNVIKTDGTGEEVVFTRPGRALWDSAISVPTLSPSGGRVAFLTQPPSSRRSFAPPIVAGPLEIWDIAAKKGRETGITALNKGLSWFPNGKRLAYVETGNPVMVAVLNVETGERTRLHMGMDPVVSTDGTSILVSMGRDGYALIDAATGAERKVTVPGNWRGPLALLGGELLLYRGLPTAGAPPKLTEYNSPFVGPKPMGSLKLAELASGKFQTIVPYLDPRTPVSFGGMTACR